MKYQIWEEFSFNPFFGLRGLLFSIPGDICKDELMNASTGPVKGIL